MANTPTRKRRSAAKSADTEAVIRGPIVEEPAPLPDMADVYRRAMAAIDDWNAVVGEVFKKTHVTPADVARAEQAAEAVDSLLTELIGTNAMTADDLVIKAAVLWPAAFRGVDTSSLDRNQKLAAAVALDAAQLVRRLVDGDTPPPVPGRGPNAHLPGVGGDKPDLLVSAIPFGRSVDSAVSAAGAILGRMAKNCAASDVAALRWVLQRIGEDADNFNGVVNQLLAEGPDHV